MKNLMLTIFLFLPFILVAHPGHGVGAGHEILHYIISPYHMGLAIVLVVLMLILVKVSPKPGFKS